MAVITLPVTFQNSFWSQDYRSGLQVLFNQLEKGVVENEEIAAFIRARAAAESALAATLTSATPGTFLQEDGASLHLAFHGLKEESIAQGKLHAEAAKDLQTKIADPFSEWAKGYKERLQSSRANILDGFVHAYEHVQSDVANLKNSYVNKTHKADELEDDVRFAPISQPVGDIYTSPSLVPRDKRVPRTPVRQPTMSERITARLKDFKLNTSTPRAEAPADQTHEVHFDADAEEKGPDSPRADKGKGRAVDPEAPMLASPPPMETPLPPPRLATDPVPPPPAPPILVAGVAFTHQELSALMTRAKAELPLRSVRFPLLGEYHDAFSGEEFTMWLRENVKQLDGDLDRTEEAAKELAERQGLLRRLGELGNVFENADDAFYQFRPKAFNLEVPKPKDEKILSPLQHNLSPLAENVAKRTAGFASLVTKALNQNQAGEAPYVRARREAESADNEYRIAVRKLDRQRLGLEERIEDTLKTLQKWELDRLRAVKTVLGQYQACLESLSKGTTPSLERSSTLIASYQPESDLKALIEQHRTGPFRPNAHVYESVTHDESDVVFGIDLRKWADSGFWSTNSWASSPEQRDMIPPVLTALFGALTEAYSKLPGDVEKRKTWIYEVPLVASHHLRETLNAVSATQAIPDDALAKYDAPVIASAVKLWALELDPPLCMYESWDEFRKLYPTAGAMNPDEQPSEEQHIQELQAALQKLPRIHLIVLDTLLKHLRDLIDSTAEGDEPNDVYINKLALGLGRAILRPRAETKFSIQDRHPTLLFIDLLSKYAAILPPTVEKKKREFERKVPVRKRTRPTDMRMSRSRISAGADLKELQAQALAQRGLKVKSEPTVPPVPAISDMHKDAQQLPSPDQSATSESSAVTVSDEPESQPPHDEIAARDNGSPDYSRIPPPPSKEQSVDFSKIPPPPPLASRSPVSQVQAPVSKPPVDMPPVFKEPPPEDEDLPPRPMFKEPPPELGSPEAPRFREPQMAPAARSDSPELPMPTFKEPPREPVSPAATSPGIPSPSSASRPTSPKVGSASSRSVSPVKPSLSRHSSVTSSTGGISPSTRGPRLARGPRPSGSSVSSMVSNFNNRSSITNTAGLARPGSPATGHARSPSRPTGQVKRSSASRASAFERRTMHSDAEDEVTQ
ncbi:uncharacterized protein PHACADRAFT_264420 [Phanerochaete carnosa HHB-10118-sp]|uniref:Rho-GAP domain-containing protein n=1 Tax=Phanerochaete carnosa (strain HHB-10118-sp) TaxID=650164 RepID=K5VT50_PHACS|nr:uncharacterized protein PHACADRAFT_264420 [Phanerochaete carnosa HHB-10118-sp]EKM49960.1 hypothetical protein PHACADRAFT_264420 [Phanerochaete carnosa HHB-10118-sp]